MTRCYNNGWRERKRSDDTETSGDIQEQQWAVRLQDRGGDKGQRQQTWRRARVQLCGRFSHVQRSVPYIKEPCLSSSGSRICWWWNPAKWNIQDIPAAPVTVFLKERYSIRDIVFWNRLLKNCSTVAVLNGWQKHIIKMLFWRLFSRFVLVLASLTWANWLNLVW